MSRQRLTALRPQAYEHPLDAAALDALQNTAGLETLVRKCNEWGFERLLRVQLTGSNLRVTADNFPDLHGMLREAADILDVPKVPELYIAAGGEINAFTAGVEKPIVVVNAGAVDLLTDDELLFVIVDRQNLYDAITIDIRDRQRCGIEGSPDGRPQSGTGAAI